MRQKIILYLKVFIILFITLNFFLWWRGRTAGFWSFVSLLTVIAILVNTFLRILRERNFIKINLYQKLNLLLFAVIFALVASEIFLRSFIPDLKSYPEVNGSPVYGSSFGVSLEQCDSCNGEFFYISEPNTILELKRPEFHYRHQYNSLGLRDKEFIAKKDSNEYRILGLGDSFVEGIGTSGDSTWLKQLEYRLNRDSGSVRFTTMNGGKQGSDLFFSYDLLVHCLLKYKPNLVILNQNSTDVADIIYRGAYDRYDPNGNYHAKTGPWWEFFFGASYIVRLVALHVLHYNWQLQTPAEERISMENTLAAISKKISDYERLAKKEHFDLLVVLQPLQNEFNDSNSLLSKIKVDPAIPKIDLSESLADSIKEENGKTALFYWPFDGHFTSRGYGVEAAVIYNSYFKCKNIRGIPR